MLKGKFRWRVYNILCTILIFFNFNFGRKDWFCKGDGQDIMMQSLIPYWYFFMINFVQKHQHIFWRVIPTGSRTGAGLYLSLLFTPGLHPHCGRRAAVGSSFFLLSSPSLFILLLETSITLWTISPNLQPYWTLPSIISLHRNLALPWGYRLPCGTLQ